MNDTELDEMLNQWDTPPVPAELRARVQDGLEVKKNPRRRWFTWPSWEGGKGLFAGLAAGAVVFLVVIAQAFPQSLGLGTASPALTRFPWVVMSSVTQFADSGSSRLDAIRTSYSYKGTEILVTETYPGNAVRDFFMGFHNGVHHFMISLAPGLLLPESAEKDAWFNAYVDSGCVDKGETVIGHEVILGHATTVIQQVFPMGWRWTASRAPDLGCFELRTKSEEPLPGGGHRLVKQRDAQRVLYRTGPGWR